MAVARRYLKARFKKEKIKILDEFCATAGYNRNYAIEKLRNINFKGPPEKKRVREKLYSAETDAVLIQIWETYGCICAERLHPFIPEGLRILEKFDHIGITDGIKNELFKMSRSTIGRRIARHRKLNVCKGFSATKPGTLLKKHIPIQTKSWDINKAGFMEMDLVAHCGGSLSGDFIYTLQAVDIRTTWTERVAVMGKSQKVVFEGIKDMRERLPFPLLGIDSDNGSEFINDELWKYCEKEDIKFTRSRPYEKKDNAHIEQKNWTLVRKILGYSRFDTQHQLLLINDLYDNELRLFINFFQPTLKLASKERYGARIKRVYDKAKTPYRRVMESCEVTEEKKKRLKAVYEAIDPMNLRQNIDKQLKNIFSCVDSGF